MNHWKTWRFDQMAINVNDRVDNPAEAGVDRYVGLEHLDPDSLKIRRWGSPTDVEATKLRFRKGDIIFGRRRVYQRKVAVADFDGICSAHAMVLRPKTDIVCPEFLPYFLQNDTFMERALEVSVGSLSPTINWAKLAAQEFLLPPMLEQLRIAKLAAAIQGAQEALDDAGTQIDQLRRAVLWDAFSEIRSRPDVTLQRVGQVGEVLMGRQRAPQYDRGISPRPYLRVANVFDGYIDTSDVKSMDFSDSEFELYQLRPGDILLNEGQSRELVGRSSIFSGEIEGCCFQNTLLRFRATTVLPQFAQAYFQYCLYTGKFAAIAKQTTSIAHLGSTRFTSMRFPVPPESVQVTLIDKLSAINASVVQLAQRRAEIRNLRQQAWKEAGLN